MQQLFLHRLSHDRSTIDLLLVSPDVELLGKLRHVLAELGFGRVRTVNSHIMALDKLLAQRFDLVMFDARPTNMPPDQFVKQVLRIVPGMTLVALSGDPSIDDVFAMLRNGARGFLRLPMSVQQVEQVILNAVTGEPFNQQILYATDRDKALAVMVLNCFSRLAESIRYVREFPNALSDVSDRRSILYDSVGLAKTFSAGGDLILRDKICDECCIRAEQPSTRLGRARKRLREQRESLNSQ